MLKLYTRIVDLLRGERGQDLVEYALITILVSIAIISAVVLIDLPGAFSTWATDVYDCVSDTSGASCPFGA
jgi:Flp pilus assembly pilin Flp